MVSPPYSFIQRYVTLHYLVHFPPMVRVPPLRMHSSLLSSACAGVSLRMVPLTNANTNRLDAIVLIFMMQ